MLKMMWSEDNGEKLSAQVQRLGRLVSEIRQACGLPDESKHEGKDESKHEGKDESNNEGVRYICLICLSFTLALPHLSAVEELHFLAP